MSKPYRLLRRFAPRNDVIMILILLLMTGCSSVRAPVPPSPQPVAVMPVPEPEKPQCTFLQKGLASWYGHELAGNKTANGEMFNPDGISAAHRTLPFGTILHVTLDSGKGNPEGVYVRVNDRGPFKKARIIDLSWGAAKKLNMMDTQKVHVYKCS